MKISTILEDNVFFDGGNFPLAEELFEPRNRNLVISLIKFMANNQPPAVSGWTYDLQEITHKHYPPTELFSYRGTKVDKMSLDSVIEGTLKLKASRPYRSWTRNRIIANGFITEIPSSSIGILLQEQVPINDIIIDFSNQEVVDEFKKLITAMLSHVNSDDRGSLFRGLRHLKEEAEVLRYVRNTQYAVGENIIKVSFHSARILPHQKDAILQKIQNPEHQQIFRERNALKNKHGSRISMFNTPSVEKWSLDI